MADSPETYDLVIVGGGIVGSALALACADLGLSIAVLEARPPVRSWPAGEVDRRVSALNRASQRILARLGAWERIVALGVSPYREMRVWDAVGGGRIHFDSADLGEPDLGHIVENRAVQLALWERLEQSPAVAPICPARITDLVLDAAQAVVTLHDGRRLAARLVVGADGRDSAVREFAGIATRGWDYDQRAIVALARPERWHAETAWQRFLPSGPLALLPLADGRCAIVWSAAEARAEALLALSDAAFCEALDEASDQCLGRILEVGPRAPFTLRLQHAVSYCGVRVALIGDAAHALHPLAGQGLNLGLLDAAALAEAIARAWTQGRDIGAQATLRRYERARRGDNVLMLAAMDAFKRLFSNEVAPIAAARSLGLAVTDRVWPIKGHFMAAALGVTGDRPPLARP
ncbi:Ubiquinone biosynthesis hydroxylase, UbiH/UbiF/VisC/COQ6 family [Thioflavicoccus mobilis 8321]|uniref:Ubiquinone biosynthesis hydroxylase, UbiH/UbiF/VisC/COQ6 family n=1 Tax=Thioflavicoccus mobilis 8321 TaxID=765912 RepID=L0GXB3_9GAMM|nr:UbiH/UbiF/VisC/COQ6 family ubiquinone biosynthesis hydroxylase [Thioflavicoccus mobilis]AGA89995.1 Ubiquinone biosynthesis hydroxylase, UbiH/UbiF/VisC/COQ6 family [Thioflavicoccus mobilis 8321]